MLSRHLPTWHIIRRIATQAKVEPRMLFADAKHLIFGVIPAASAFCLGEAALEVAAFCGFDAAADLFVMLRKVRFWRRVLAFASWLGLADDKRGVASVGVCR